ncbi:MAG: UbiX family flavin prenyltransferase [Sporolactobacillus sp.]
MNIIVGVTGASGTIFAVKLLEALHQAEDVTTHLIMSDWAKNNLEIETDYAFNEVKKLADELYDNRNLGARTSSGSFLTDGMVIVPCSMKTLSAVANGYEDSLITRTAEVMLKENRRLILCPRESPLSAIHLENMLKLARLGVRIVPPMPAFYNHPKTLDDMVNHHVMKILDQLGIPNARSQRWNG